MLCQATRSCLIENEWGWTLRSSTFSRSSPLWVHWLHSHTGSFTTSPWPSSLLSRGSDLKQTCVKTAQEAVCWWGVVESCKSSWSKNIYVFKFLSEDITHCKMVSNTDRILQLLSSELSWEQLFYIFIATTASPKAELSTYQVVNFFCWMTLIVLPELSAIGERTTSIQMNEMPVHGLTPLLARAKCHQQLPQQGFFFLPGGCNMHAWRLMLSPALPGQQVGVRTAATKTWWHLETLPVGLIMTYCQARGTAAENQTCLWWWWPIVLPLHHFIGLTILFVISNTLYTH